MMTRARTGFLLYVTLLLAGCEEDEKSCYARISADLRQVAEDANAAGNRARATIALESDLSAFVILKDVDRSICDYVTADAHLQRK